MLNGVKMTPLSLVLTNPFGYLRFHIDDFIKLCICGVLHEIYDVAMVGGCLWWTRHFLLRDISPESG